MVERQKASNKSARPPPLPPHSPPALTSTIVVTAAAAAWTPSQFVKYLDAEVERLEDATKKSDRPGAGDEVLNVMKIVRIRVCAQVDLMMGEDVAVLTRMLSYNDRYMMRAALRSGKWDGPRRVRGQR